MKLSSNPIRRYTVWVCLVLAIISSYLVFWYSDIGDTLDNGVLLAEAIVNGEFLDYYEYASLNSSPYSVYSANYNVLLYAIFAIWNLPTVILHILTDFDYMTSCAALLWCKAIIPATLALTFFTVKRVTERIGGNEDDALLAGFLSLSSLCVMVPALVASQYDCISLLFMLLGIMFYAEKKTVPFILMFAIAVPLKLFAVFIFIPMILIRFKNVLKLAGMLIGVMIPSFLLELPFKGNLFYEAALGSQNRDAIDLLLGANVSLGKASINLFFVAYIVICFICYAVRSEDSVQESRLAVYFSFAVFGAFCTLVPIRSYWAILYTPFMAILASIKKGNRVLPVLADTLAGFGGGLYFLAHHWIYNTGTIAGYLLLSVVETEIGTEQKYGHFEGFLQSFGLLDFKYALFAVFVGATAFALWYLYPEKQDVSSDTEESKDNEESHVFWALLARPAILIFVTALLIFCQFATVPEIKYGAQEYDKTMDINLLDDHTVSREIVFETDETLSELTLHLNAYAHRASRSFVGVRLYDSDTDKLIWSDSVGIVLIKDDLAKFDLDGLAVEGGKTYRLEVYPILPELFYNGYVYPYKDSNGELAVTIR